MKVALLFLTTLFILHGHTEGDGKRILSVIQQTVPNAVGGGGGTIFNVKDHGAVGDGTANDCKAFEDAWKAACAATGTPKVLVPKGKYLLGPVQFGGPCPNAQTITFQMEGDLLAPTDLGLFQDKQEWIMFGPLNGLILTGGGTFDGQGHATYDQNKCPKQTQCKLLPNNVKFHALTNSTVTGINSLNPKLFHFGVVGCENLHMSGLKITADGDSPNTDGMHIERCTHVSLCDSVIATGDDCVSLGQGNTDVSITGITCGPGHGISVGSLGKYPIEKDVNGLLIKNCTLTGTMFGARIKTWEDGPVAITARNITYEDIIVNDVGNPIIIDQTYCPYPNCKDRPPSKVKLQDITFRNIKGTSKLPEAITLECSKSNPCSNVIVENVDLKPSVGTNVTSICENAEHKFIQTTCPAPCPPA